MKWMCWKYCTRLHTYKRKKLSIAWFFLTTRENYHSVTKWQSSLCSHLVTRWKSNWFMMTRLSLISSIMFTEEEKNGFHMPFCNGMDVSKILYQIMYIPKKKLSIAWFFPHYWVKLPFCDQMAVFSLQPSCHKMEK
jgi:hypothetical protein